MNKVFLMGRLTRDAEIRYTENNAMAIAKFSLAVDRIKRDEADFISCVAFGKTAEFIEKYITKGTKVVVEGRWQTGSYDNKEGKKVYTNDCVVDHIEFAESKKSGQETGVTGTVDEDGFMSIPDGLDEELPFN